jgi:molybdenum cofactor synthesis domain-containing protein
MSADKIYTAAILIIGNEVLSGRTKDANLPFLAERLNQLGVRLMEARVVRDDEVAIVEAVNQTRHRYDYVFTTGGIGPTHDDITSDCVAKAFGVPLIRHPEALKLLETHYKPGELNEARLRMANTPEGAVLVHNPVSRAPGFQIGNVFVMAGVPAIMRAMFEGVQSRLTGGKPQQSRTVVSQLPEGLLAKGLGEIQDRYPDLEIGSYPYFRRGAYGTSLVLRGVDPVRLDAGAEEVRGLIRELGGTPLDEAPTGAETG